LSTNRAKTTAGRDSGKGGAAPKSKRTRARAESLGPGLFAGKIELAAGRAFRVRVAGIGSVNAVLADDVDRSLAEECLRAGRTMIVGDTERGPTILGALQTSAPIVADVNGTLSVTAKDIKLRAQRRLVLEAGPASLSLDHAGVVRAEGERLVLDMASLVRILAARVELP
jgi:hypothetical protein